MLVNVVLGDSHRRLLESEPGKAQLGGGGGSIPDRECAPVAFTMRMQFCGCFSLMIIVLFAA